MMPSKTMHSKKTAAKLALITVLMLGVSSCSLAPDFMLPDAKTPKAFNEAEAMEGSWKLGVPAANQPRGEWWTVFNDETLNKLEQEAMKDNQSLAATAARVKAAWAEAGIASSYFFPTIDGNTSFTRQKPNAVARGMAAGTDLKIEDSYKAGLGLSYELDLFGSVLNGKKAAKEDAEAAEGNLKSATLSLQADVADLYFTLRALDTEIALLNNTLKIRQDSLNILQKRLDAGTITELDTSSSVVDLETTRSDLQGVIQHRKEAEHALAVLLGIPPANFKLTEKPFDTAAPMIPAGLPSELLERRPDIAAAQHQLAAANARIGISRAAFFPDISLTSSGGLESSLLGQLFKWSSRSWAFGPLVSIPIFSGGRATANNDKAWAQYEESVANYRQQILVAFRDVEDSLSSITTLQAQADAQAKAETAAKRAETLAEKRYDSGDTGYLEFITARRQALDIERQGISVRLAKLSSTVRLIRALGGGWGTGAAEADINAKGTEAENPPPTAP